MKLKLLLILLVLALFDTAPLCAQRNGIAERYTYKSSNVLIKEGGEWRAVASHVSGYREQE
jgi:hypothetical protein